ncbi:hypothetical protein OHA72_15970 [Dactylosporangium sp. NBC_01737]|uniref:hypothetical protein n=1 Tax=Dactylosporangium sp. NBC_01737 TaxID=2975959 RepID=UPI002E118210|nr:hypothetical protein OHA72_15970 [Dactylosporangium sp. NBC_01737]
MTATPVAAIRRPGRSAAANARTSAAAPQARPLLDTSTIATASRPWQKSAA